MKYLASQRNPIRNVLTILVALILVLAAVAANPAQAVTRTYPNHTNIVSTTFWVGEVFNANASDGSQICSTYDAQWALSHTGVIKGVAPSSAAGCPGSPWGGCDGVDNQGTTYTTFTCSTEARSAATDYFPTRQPRPLQNPFYLTLPYDDLNDPIGFANRCTDIPWANDPGYTGHCTDSSFSYMKNRWVAITGPNGRTCYGQIEDAGPSSGTLYHDAAYVFGSNDARPANKLYSGDPTQGAGMDVSPALNGCLGYTELDGDNDHVGWHFVDDPDVPAGPWTDVVTTSKVIVTAPTAPAAPTRVTATAANASAVVSWRAPNNNGSAITSYAVTPHAGTATLAPVTVSGNPPSTSTTVTGLTNGTAYTFTVTATNAIGTSPASAASAPVTPTAAATAPAAPSGVVATAGDASAVVSWTAPANGGSPITSYAVTPHAGTTTLAPVTVSGNPPSTSTTVTGLTNGTAYTFTVTATNAIGTSPASAASAAVTPTATTTSTITNGGFESGLTSWATGGVKAPVASTVAHSGAGSALLGLASGTEPLGDSSLSQTITVPAAGTSTLSFWYQPHTTDSICSGTTCQYDWMEAQVRTTGGTVLASLFKLCNNNGTWTQLSADLSAYKGQTIVLRFNVHLDGANPADDTWMYLDDVTLTNNQTTATAPSAPSGVTATAGNASATVSWTAPSNGGSQITSYAVTPHADTTTLAPVTVSGNPPSTSTTVTGLTNGTAYTFTVTATNAIGTSPASAASAAVTPTATTTSTITNGGFESGLTSWATGGVKAPVASTVAHSGAGSALLGLASGTEPLGDSSLSQTITVPAAGTSTLSFWYQPHTTDSICSGTTCQYDWMEAQVRTTGGTVLASLFKLCNNNGTWTQLSADLSAYKGQTIVLRFNVHLDGANPADDTWMYLDDVTLTNG